MKSGLISNIALAAAMAIGNIGDHARALTRSVSRLGRTGTPCVRTRLPGTQNPAGTKLTKAAERRRLGLRCSGTAAGILDHKAPFGARRKAGR